MYFAIIFGNHVVSVALPLAYYPSILTSVASFAHLGALLGMVINTVCVDEEEAGRGGRSVTNRIFWICIPVPIQ